MYRASRLSPLHNANNIGDAPRSRDALLERGESEMSPETAAAPADPIAGSSDETSPAGSSHPHVLAALTRVLARTLRKLGQAGEPWDASRLAAEGWSLLRSSSPADAERLNGAMHYLARLEQKLEAEGHHDPKEQ